MAANDVVSSPLRSHLIPCLQQPLSRLLVSLYLDECLLFLPPHLYKAATLVKSLVSVKSGILSFRVLYLYFIAFTVLCSIYVLVS